MTTDNYERDFYDQIATRFPGRWDPLTLQNIDNAGDGFPGLQKAIRNWIQRYLHDGVIEQALDMNSKDINNVNDLNVDGDLDVDGITNLDDVDIDGTLDVAGVADFHSTVDMNSQKIENVLDPVANQEAATLKYVQDNSINNVVEDLTPEFGGDFDALDNRLRDLKNATFDAEKWHGDIGTGTIVDFNEAQKHGLEFSQNAVVTLEKPHDGVGNFLLKTAYGGLYDITWTPTDGVLYWAGGSAPELSISGVDLVGLYFDGTNWYAQASERFM